MGVLRWPEDVFWSASLHAYAHARNGYAKANGAGARGVSSSDAKHLKSLMAEYPATVTV